MLFITDLLLEFRNKCSAKTTEINPIINFFKLYYIIRKQKI